MNILIKSATLVVPGNIQLHMKQRDILIKDGVIEKIAASVEAPKNCKVVQRKHLHVSEGWLDSGVSFGEPGFEERETLKNGLRTAAESGFVDVVLNPNTNPLPDTSPDIAFLLKMASGAATGLHPLGNLSQKGEGVDLAELYDMQNTGAVGFSDFKHPLKNANLLKIALLYGQNFGALIHSFPLETSIGGKGVANEGENATKLGLKGIPAMAEELQVARDLFILEYTGGKLHIPTISTEGSIKLIAAAKKKGLDVSCSVAIHNLWFTDDTLKDFDSNFKVMPPLREAKHQKALRKAVEQGVIDFVTSDHTPLDVEHKRLEFDNAEYGTIGLESAFGALNVIFGAEKTVELLTQHKERYQVKPAPLEEGSEARLSLFDPTADYIFGLGNIQSTSKNSMFMGQKLKGMALGVVANGQLVYKG